jgi:predicted metalloprotease with PDZ domain
MGLFRPRAFAGLLLAVLAVVPAFANPSTSASAQNTSRGTASSPQRAQDRRLPGPPTSMAPIRLELDATQVSRKVFHSRMTFPVSGARDLTLNYPEWIPGEHGPTGPLVNLMGMKFSANGKPLKWRRDLVEMYTIHVEVPPGATSVDAELDFMSPNNESGFSAGSSTTAQLAVVSWNQVLLYPSGAPSADIMVNASLKLPAGWKFGTALPIAGQTGEMIQFQPAPLNTLVDSPVITGAFLRVVPLQQGRTPAHEMDIAADSVAALDFAPEVVDHYDNLVAESGALFGARHYRDYHFLLTLSDNVAHFGLEHHESNDSRLGERSLIEENRLKLTAYLLPHEFVHSWNGKYRRPADLTTPNYQAPMKTDLLWVYEGLTNYLGEVLAARSGLWTPDQYRQYLAFTAALLNHTPGRTWRPLQDTADEAQILYDSPRSWENWRRSTDFYEEGSLLWLDVDTTIRKQTGNQRSLDDFCKLFYGGQNTGPTVKTYTFDDIVSALNQVAPFEWRAFLTERLNSLAPQAPMGGVANGGWKLVYDENESDLLRAHEEERKIVDVSFSLGLLLEEDGTVIDSIVNMPSGLAGISPAMKLVAVNGRRYTPDVLHDAIKGAKQSKQPIELLINNNDYFKTYALDYHDGERYPHLVRDEAQQDLLKDIIRPHAATLKAKTNEPE